MIVMKFGGSSLVDAAHVRAAADLVLGAAARGPLVVCSAHGGVTDRLLTAADDAAHGAVDPAPLVEHHRDLARALGVDVGEIEPLLEELRAVLRGAALGRRVTPRTLDLMASFGERLSCRIMAGHLRARGMDARAVDAGEAGLITDSVHQNATPLAETFGNLERSLSRLDAVPVVTGFIGRSVQGEVTTLGRSGSDYSASIVGAAVHAQEIQIWTDVDGVLTADPSLIPAAAPIPLMSFEEAGELAYFGARVLHPSTMQPAVDAGIPVRVLNTLNPRSPGTLIVAEREDDAAPVTSIAYKEDITIITMKSTRLLLAHGFLAQLFAVFGEERIVVDMIATSEISVSCTVDGKTPRDAVERARARLRQYAEVRIEPNHAIICVVGHHLRSTPGISARVFTAVANRGVNVRMISQGASRMNIAFVVPEDEIEHTVSALHREFFEAAPDKAVTP